MERHGNSLWKEIKYWSQIIILPIYGLSFFIPRSNRIWVFGSTFSNRFADNPKYFYLYLTQYEKADIKPIWISKNKEVIRLLHMNNYQAYYQNSLKGIWYSLRAKIYIFDNYSKDINFLFSGGAIKINLWHGIPLKKIQKDNLFDKVRNPNTKWEKLKYSLRRISDEKPSHYVLTTANFLEPIFSSAFQTKKVLVCGYPRNDFLIFDDIQNLLTAEEERLYQFIQNENKKMVLYMPTFRTSEDKLIDIIDFDQFHNFLKDNNILFYIKVHPKSKLKNKLKDLISYDDIILLNADFDPYPILKRTDVLITDYSSIYFDFLLMDKPILFFDYDRNEYLENSREMYFDYDDFTPGKKVKTMLELEMALLEEDQYNEERCKIKNKVFDDLSEMSSKRLYRKITTEIIGIQK